MTWEAVALGALVLLAAVANILIGFLSWYARNVVDRVRKLEIDMASMSASMAALVEWLRHTPDRRARGKPPAPALARDFRS